VSYVVTDGSGADDNSTLTITVDPVNDDFTDANEAVTVNEDSSNNTGSLLSGTSSVDGAVSIKSFSIAGEPVGSTFTLGTAYTVTGKGTITINADGSYSFTPVANWNGAFPVVSYVVTDGSGADDNSTLTITVDPVNDDFTDANEAVTVNEDSSNNTGSLLSGTSSVDGAVSIKSFSIAGEPVGSTFTLGTAYTVTGKGTITINADGSYSFTPVANWNGAFPVVSYVVTDGSGADDNSTLTITVDPVNDDFTDANEAVTVNEDSSNNTGSLLSGTSSVDGAVSIKSFSIAGEPVGSTFTLGTAYTVTGKGTITINADGSYSFTPVANWNGAFPVVSYVVTDGSGADDNSTLTITVDPVNDDFTDANEAVTVNEDSSNNTGSLLSGTSSVDGAVSIKSFSIAGEPVGSTFTLGTAYTVTGKGTITINADGSYSFTPVANWNGAFPVVSYVVTDGSGADDNSTLTITVDPVNDAPAGTDKSVTNHLGTPYVFTESDFGFSDPIDKHAFEAVKFSRLPNYASGELQYQDAGGWRAVVKDEVVSVDDIMAGKLRFAFTSTVGLSDFTTDFEFQVQDDGGTPGVDTDPTPNTFTLEYEEFVPVVTVPLEQFINEDSTLVFSGDKALSIVYTEAAGVAKEQLEVLLELDKGSKGSLALASNQPAGVTVTVNGDGSILLVGYDSDITKALDGLVFTPLANDFSAIDGEPVAGRGVADGSHTYATLKITSHAIHVDDVAEPYPHSAQVSTVDIVVNAVNDAPDGADKTLTLNEDAVLTLAVADFGFSDVLDTLPDHDLLAVKITTLPTAGTLELEWTGGQGWTVHCRDGYRSGQAHLPA
jgi:hypothetical protein